VNDNDTPPIAMLLAYWREITAKGGTIGGWGIDRAEAILAYIAELEAHVEQLRGTIAFNREQHARTVKQHRAYRDESRQRIAELEHPDNDDVIEAQGKAAFPVLNVRGALIEALRMWKVGITGSVADGVLDELGIDPEMSVVALRDAVDDAPPRQDRAG